MGKNDTQLVDEYLQRLGDWHGTTLRELRALIRAAVPHVVEEIKWRKPTNPSGVPAWSSDGLICTGEVYKDKVKLTFASGAALSGGTGLFNASLDAGTRRAIDVHEGAVIDPKAFKALVREAAAFNAAKKRAG